MQGWFFLAMLRILVMFCVMFIEYMLSWSVLDHHEALLTPGILPCKAFSLNWNWKSHNARQWRSEARNGNAYPTETKLAHDAPSTTRLRTPVFYGGGAGVPPESVELELGLIADLGGEGLVSSYVEVSSASDFVGCHAFAGFDVAKDPDFRHGLFSL